MSTLILLCQKSAVSVGLVPFLLPRILLSPFERLIVVRPLVLS